MRGGAQILARLQVGIVAIAATVGIVAVTAAPTPAEARVFVGIGVGVPFPGYYAPYPYFPPYPAYYPYYPPPPAYYPPSEPAGYYPPAAATAPPAAPANITYTNRPAFTNAAGQICREYRATNGAAGTACQDGSGVWRVAN